jgi:predicted DNA-binding transcriptional regulator AlpA
MTSELLTAVELAEKLKTPAAVLANWRYRGIGPKFIKLGKSVRYRVSDVDAWLDAQTRSQTGVELASA